MAGLLSSFLGGGDSPDYTGSAPTEAEIQGAQDEFDSAKYDPEKTKAAIDGSMGDLDVSDGAMRGAIASRARRSFAPQANLLRSQADMMGVDSRVSEFQRDYDFERKMRRLVKAVQQRRLQAEQNKIAARNAVVANVLKAGGMAIGAYFGGPMGAAAGAAAAGAIAPQNTSTKRMADFGPPAGAKSFKDQDQTETLYRNMEDVNQMMNEY